MYQITADPANHRLDVDFIGDYADIDQADFSRALRAEALKVKGSGRYFDLLVDYTRIHVMPKEETEHGREEIQWCLANGLRKSANVMNSAIMKMQIQRLTANDRFQMFGSRADAIAWLGSSD